MGRIRGNGIGYNDLMPKGPL